MLKTNWNVGGAGIGRTYDYEPERLLYLFRELRTVYREVLDLDIYGVFAQGSNEYYDDPLLHVAGNHISLNSLGLPFAQIQAIEHAARTAIRAGKHGRFELYLDDSFFRSLRIAREGILSSPYPPKMSTAAAEYFYAGCDDLLERVEQFPRSLSIARL